MEQRKVMVVSGGASGLGLAAAEKFASNGYDIVIIDIDGEKGAIAEDKIKNMGQDAMFCLADISDKSQIQAAAAKTEAHFGHVNVLINNAGLEVRGSILQCEEEDWIRLYNINLKGIYYMANAFIPLIKKQGSGAVVNTGSILGYRAVGERAAYSSSKGAIDSLTRSMAFDLAPEIRVNCVAPGAIDTPLLRGSINDSPDPAETERVLGSKSVFGRMGTSEEVANVMYFLASEEASFVTGSTYFVDGGWSML